MSKAKECGSNHTIAEYTYDYNGNRMVKKNYLSGTHTNTVTSWSDSFETKTIVGGATENTSYYFVNNELYAKKDKNGNRFYMHNDHLGSVSLVTDASGNKSEDTEYDPWGQLVTGGTKSKYLYTGQEHDAETGLEYYNFRYYNSDIRRFTQPDDIIQEVYKPQTINRYSYVTNNPIRYTDPSGHCIEDACIGEAALLMATMPILGNAIQQMAMHPEYLNMAANVAVTAPQVSQQLNDGDLPSAAMTVGFAALNLSGGKQKVSAPSGGQRTQNMVQEKPGAVVPQKGSGFKLGNIEVKGKEISIGDNLRIAPIGNPSAKKADGSPNIPARLPHYHQKKEAKPNNNDARTSKSWHRPWETLFRKWFKK